MKAGYRTISAFTALAFFGPCMAAGAAEGKGLPQLNPAYFAPQIFWLAITFGVFYVLMAAVAVPRIQRVLNNRSESIQKALDEATALRDSALKATSSYETTLADSRQKAQALLAETAAEQAKIATAKQATLMAQLAQKTTQAEANLAATRQKSLASIDGLAAPLVTELVEKLGHSATSSAVNTTVQQMTRLVNG